MTTMKNGLESVENKNENKGLIKRGWDGIKNVGSKIKNVFKKDTQPENIAGASKPNQSNQQNTIAIEQSSGIDDNTSAFLRYMINNVERDRTIANLIFSEEFKNAIEHEDALTPSEQQSIQSQEQWVIPRLVKGGEYQNLEAFDEIIKKRGELVKKLDSGREGVRSLDLADVEIILVTIGSRDEWLKELYEEVKDFATKRAPDKQAEVAAEVLSKLTSVPSLKETNVIGRYSLLPREKIKMFIDSERDKELVNRIENIVNNVLPEKVQEKERNDIKNLCEGLLTSPQEKLRELEKSIFYKVERLNAANAGKPLTSEEIDKRYSVYDKIRAAEETIEQIIKAKIDDKQTEEYELAAKIVRTWKDNLKEDLEKRVNQYFEIYEKSVEILKNKKIDKEKILQTISGINKEINDIETILSNKGIISSEKVERLLKNLKTINTIVYPLPLQINNIREQYSKRGDSPYTQIDLLKMRASLRDPPIEITKLNKDTEEKQGFFNRASLKIKKSMYKFFKWFGFSLLKEIAIAAAKIAYVIIGGKTIKDNWHHKQIHPMYPPLSRRTGVIINTIITRIGGAILALSIGAHLFPDTWVEDLAIKTKLKEPVKIVKVIKKKNEDNIYNLVLIDQNDKERKISEKFAEEKLGVRNIELLRAQPEAAIYLYEKATGEVVPDAGSKDTGGQLKRKDKVLDKSKADDMLRDIQQLTEKKIKELANKKEAKKELKERIRYTINLPKWEIRKNGLAVWRWFTTTEYILPYEEINKFETEFKFIDKGYLYSRDIEEYKTRYNLTPEESKTLYKIATRYETIKSFLTRGASKYYIKDAKAFLNDLNNQNWKLGDEIKITLNPLPSYMEELLDINAEFGLDVNSLDNENIEHLISLKNSSKMNDLKKFLNGIRGKYQIQNQNELISKITKLEDAGEDVTKFDPNSDKYTTLLEHLKNEGIIHGNEPEGQSVDTTETQSQTQTQTSQNVAEEKQQSKTKNPKKTNQPNKLPGRKSVKQGTQTPSSDQKKITK